MRRFARFLVTLPILLLPTTASADDEVGTITGIVLESLVMEAMTYPLPETSPGIIGETALDDILTNLQGKKCLAVGPGIGTDSRTAGLIHKIIAEADIPMVIDADGLNVLAGHTNLLKKLSAPSSTSFSSASKIFKSSWLNVRIFP